MLIPSIRPRDYRLLLTFELINAFITMVCKQFFYSIIIANFILEFQLCPIQWAVFAFIAVKFLLIFLRCQIILTLNILTLAQLTTNAPHAKLLIQQ